MVRRGSYIAACYLRESLSSGDISFGKFPKTYDEQDVREEYDSHGNHNADF